MSRHSPNSVLLDSQLGEVTSVAVLVEDFNRYGEEVLCLSKETLKTRKSHLKYLVEYCMRNDLDYVYNLNNIILDDFFTEYGKKRSKNTVNTARRIMKVFLRWLYDYRELSIRANPDAIRLVKIRDKIPKALDDTLIARVIRESQEEQDALMIAVMRESGIRIGEIIELRTEDLIDTQLQIMGKGGIDRMVNITGQLALRLKKFIKDNKRLPHEPLFQNTWAKKGGKLSIGTARLRIQRCFKDIADLEMTPHQLRHSMAVGLLRDGCDLVTIQTQLGHKDIQTTMIYLRIENSFFKESYARSMKKSFLSY